MSVKVVEAGTQISDNWTNKEFLGIQKNSQQFSTISSYFPKQSQLLPRFGIWIPKDFQAWSVNIICIDGKSGEFLPKSWESFLKAPPPSKKKSYLYNSYSYPWYCKNRKRLYQITEDYVMQSDSYTKSVAARLEYCLHDVLARKKHVKCLIHFDCTKLILVFKNELQ